MEKKKISLSDGEAEKILREEVNRRYKEKERAEEALRKEERKNTDEEKTCRQDRTVNKRMDRFLAWLSDRSVFGQIMRKINRDHMGVLEKILRKKRVNIYFLEFIMGLFYHCLFILPVFYLLTRSGIFLLIVSVLLFIAVLGDMLWITVTVFYLIKYKRDDMIEEDIIVTGYSAMPVILTTPNSLGEWRTMLAFNFSEPFLQHIELEYFRIDSNSIPSPNRKIRFFIPTVYKKYFFHEDYKKIKQEYEEYRREADEYEDYFLDFSLKNLREDQNEACASFCLTYEKMKVLNRLFDIVESPEFRIQKHRGSDVLISLDPIPEKEYPEEALDLMKKFKGLYP